MNLDGLIAGFLAAFITALLGYFGVVRKAKSDETSLALAAWKDLLEPLKQELIDAKNEISLLRQELSAAEERHKSEQTRLTKQINDLKKQLNRYTN